MAGQGINQRYFEDCGLGDVPFQETREGRHHHGDARIGAGKLTATVRGWCREYDFPEPYQNEFFDKNVRRNQFRSSCFMLLDPYANRNILMIIIDDR